MNLKFLRYRLPLLIASLALSNLAGCASLGSSGTKKLLDEAGFRTHAPSTPKQHELYAAIPAYQVERVTYNGKTFYAYKDERDGIAYVGDQANYAEYQKLAVQHQVAQQEYEAVAMNPNLAMGWYGAYGPYVGGFHHYGRYR
ncbi:hypothetical protein CfE428DRAFT_6016 [Chthoniobacter flavus Ellin428]|uniref:Lipoprotein n=1 Tax=Chthoniobacter flavus Ellin428 TaxID=497964 RepID=B4DAS5_9BACT|nr:hypothetical protein [Chthoniobacter flavus]EDY16485.1 hypothetical protein CfE428DRAFT_6016 [Chthoniobacter flavus Ellin428]TCO92752.1 hypothetical protein EV701_10529 [Chthoniobacter flavus]